MSDISPFKTLQQASSELATINPGIIAVPEAQGTAGAVVWWRLSGTLDLERMTAAWEAEGLSKKLLPAYPSDHTALLRAASDIAGKRLLARPLEGTRGWALVQEVAKGEGLDYEVLITARITKDQGLKIEVGPNPQAQILEARLWSSFERFQHELTLNDASSWLSKLIRTTQAAALRDTGGVYFVPRSHVEIYRRLANAIHAASAHKLFEVPALHSDEAVEAILEAILREAENETQLMETELDTKELGARALHTRQGRCNRMREKVQVYEDLLGRSLEGLHKRMEALEASLTTAILLSQPQQDLAI